MTPEAIAALEELERAATPGPWRVDDCNVFCGPMADARSAAIFSKYKSVRRPTH